MFSKDAKNQRGFTIIELIVVIAIIAILSAIVTTNVMGYVEKAKMAKVQQEFNNIKKSLVLFFEKYGDYPGGHIEGPASFCSTCDNKEPNLIVGGENYKMSEFYKLDWNELNAKFFDPTAYYQLDIYDECEPDCDTKKRCVEGWLWHKNGAIYKNLICEDCPSHCGAEEIASW